MEEAVSKCTLRWPLSFHIRLKSFGFSSKKEFTSFLLQISWFQTVLFGQKPPKRLLLQDYALWPAGQTQFPPFSAHGDGTS